MDNNVSTVRKDSRNSAVNIPNALTVLRLLLVPVFIWLKLTDTWEAQWWALGVFMVAAATDHFDGRIARARGIITDFGRIADPIADKALTLSAFVLLSVEEVLPWWFTVLIAIRELGITALRAWFLRRGVVVAANMGGKVKTVLQLLAIWLLLIPWPFFVELNEANRGWATVMTYVALGIAGVALAMTLWSGGEYLLEGLRIRKELEASSTEMTETLVEDGQTDADEAEGCDGETDAPDRVQMDTSAHIEDEYKNASGDTTEPVPTFMQSYEQRFSTTSTPDDGEKSDEDSAVSGQPEFPFETRMERRQREE